MSFLMAQDLKARTSYFKPAFCRQDSDLMFSVAPEAVPFMNKNFVRNWEDKTLVSVYDHLGKSQVVVLDYRNLTSVNQQTVNNWIVTLTPTQRAQLLIVR